MRFVIGGQEQAKRIERFETTKGMTVREFTLTATIEATDDGVRVLLSAFNDQIEAVIADDEIMKDVAEVEIGSWVEQGGEDRPMIFDDLRFVFTNRGGELVINEHRLVTLKAVSEVLETEGYLVTTRCKETLSLGGRSDRNLFQCSILEGHSDSHVSDDIESDDIEGVKLFWGGHGEG